MMLGVSCLDTFDNVCIALFLISLIHHVRVIAGS